MFGGLHTEMIALENRAFGTLLQSNGWTGALVEAGVGSSGLLNFILLQESKEHNKMPKTKVKY